MIRQIAGGALSSSQVSRRPLAKLTRALGPETLGHETLSPALRP